MNSVTSKPEKKTVGFLSKPYRGLSKK